MAILNATLSAIRQGFMEYLGEYYSFTAQLSAAAGADLIDLVNLPRFANDHLNSWWCLLPSGPSGVGTTEHRKVSVFVQSTGKITPLSAFSAQVLLNAPYELLRYHPTELIGWALNKALQEVSKELPKQILNEALITGNALPNGDFEDFAVSTAPDFWVVSVGTTSTCAQNTSIVYSGRSSASLQRAATDGYIQCSDAQWKSLLSLQGQTVSYKAKVYATVAARARLSVYANGAVAGVSSYHSGGSIWELLAIKDLAISTTLTAISFRFEVNTGNTTAYIDRARVTGPTISEFVLPSEFTIGNINRVQIQKDYRTLATDEDPCDDPGWLEQPNDWTRYVIRYDDRLGVWLLSFIERPTNNGYKIRLQGTAPITKVTSDTDTVPLSETQLNMLYPYAAYRMFSAIGDLEKAKFHRAAYEDLKKFALPEQPGPSLTLTTVLGNW